MFHGDWIGSTRYLTDGASQPGTALRFDAFGNTPAQAGPAATSYRSAPLDTRPEGTRRPNSEP